MINPFNVRVRRKNPVTGKYVKMTLQLYQVDFKSYLLDFKSLPTMEDDELKAGEERKSGELPAVLPASVNVPAVALKQSAESKQQAKDPFDSQSQCHHVIEFFEMCASLIKQLASK